MIYRERGIKDIVTPNPFEGLDLSGLNFPKKEEDPAGFRILCAKFQFLVDMCELDMTGKRKLLKHISNSVEYGVYGDAADILEINFRIAQATVWIPTLKQLINQTVLPES